MTNQEAIQALRQELLQKAFFPTFFDKLASVYGIVPQTPEEAQALFDMGLNAPPKPPAKQASAILEVANGLRGALDLDKTTAAANQNLENAKLAAALVQADPEFATVASAWGELVQRGAA